MSIAIPELVRCSKFMRVLCCPCLAQSTIWSRRTMTEDGFQVFISYHRTDLGVAEQVRAHLLKNGVKTWMDHYDIPAGAYWPDEIDRGLNQSHLVIGLLSPDAIASRNVKNEWDW